MRREIVSHPGKKDGLYWPTTAGETPSPFGDLAAEASAEGYKAGAKPIPYHGYYYRILTRQGAGAPGGAYDYLVKGKMKGGFALIAVPAEYGNSGIMTFMVNHDGTVFQKDLGPKTAKLAAKIDAFAPDQLGRRSTSAAAPSGKQLSEVAGPRNKGRTLDQQQRAERECCHDRETQQQKSHRQQQAEHDGGYPFEKIDPPNL